MRTTTSTTTSRTTNDETTTANVLEISPELEKLYLSHKVVTLPERGRVRDQNTPSSRRPRSLSANRNNNIQAHDIVQDVYDRLGVSRDDPVATATVNKYQERYRTAAELSRSRSKSPGPRRNRYSTTNYDDDGDKSVVSTKSTKSAVAKWEERSVNLPAWSSPRSGEGFKGMNYSSMEQQSRDDEQQQDYDLKSVASAKSTKSHTRSIISQWEKQKSENAMLPSRSIDRQLYKNNQGMEEREDIEEEDNMNTTTSLAKPKASLTRSFKYNNWKTNKDQVVDTSEHTEKKEEDSKEEHSMVVGNDQLNAKASKSPSVKDRAGIFGGSKKSSNAPSIRSKGHDESTKFSIRDKPSLIDIYHSKHTKKIEKEDEHAKETSGTPQSSKNAVKGVLKKNNLYSMERDNFNTIGTGSTKPIVSRSRNTFYSTGKVVDKADLVDFPVQSQVITEDNSIALSSVSADEFASIKTKDTGKKPITSIERKRMDYTTKPSHLGLRPEEGLDEQLEKTIQARVELRLADLERTMEERTARLLKQMEERLMQKLEGIMAFMK